MLSKTIYEVLPLIYITAGTISLLTLEQDFAVASGLTMFIIGAKIYNMRSQNRRTDPLRKRKSGIFPSFIYNFTPFFYLLAAVMLFKFIPSGAGPIAGICLMTYSLYILIRRSSYRRHCLPSSQHSLNL